MSKETEDAETVPALFTRFPEPKLTERSPLSPYQRKKNDVPPESRWGHDTTAEEDELFLRSHPIPERGVAKKTNDVFSSIHPSAHLHPPGGVGPTRPLPEEPHASG